MKNLNRLIFFSNFSMKNFCKKTWNFVLDHNALVSIFRFLICYHNFFIIYCENNIGVFYLSILCEEWRMYLRQKAPRNFLVRNVTLNVVKEVIGVDIYPHRSIKYEQIRMILRQKTPNNIIVIVVKCFLDFYLIVF